MGLAVFAIILQTATKLGNGRIKSRKKGLEENLSLVKILTHRHSYSAKGHIIERRKGQYYYLDLDVAGTV